MGSSDEVQTYHATWNGTHSDRLRSAQGILATQVFGLVVPDVSTPPKPGQSAAAKPSKTEQSTSSLQSIRANLLTLQQETV